MYTVDSENMMMFPLRWSCVYQDQGLVNYSRVSFWCNNHYDIDIDSMNYTQTSPISVDRSYVDVTGEGSEEFVLAIKNKWEMKQMESISLKKTN